MGDGAGRRGDDRGPLLGFSDAMEAFLLCGSSRRAGRHYPGFGSRAEHVVAPRERFMKMNRTPQRHRAHMAHGHAAMWRTSIRQCVMIAAPPTLHPGHRGTRHRGTDHRGTAELGDGVDTRARLSLCDPLAPLDILVSFRHEN